MTMPLLLGRPGPTEILIIVLIIVLLFGAAKVPELARSFGKAKGEFQKGLKEGEKEAREMDDEDEKEDA
ncbi:MAG: twin-arginine translocase TatA/TatE family subunit [Candidatus Thermoplasmatota archaeon]|nr:twin-arginine translocase TatA/TatE family subunit [Candidatus Thermoplasmatota archaeon]